MSKIEMLIDKIKKTKEIRIDIPAGYDSVFNVPASIQVRCMRNGFDEEWCVDTYNDYDDGNSDYPEGMEMMSEDDFIDFVNVAYFKDNGRITWLR